MQIKNTKALCDLVEGVGYKSPRITTNEHLVTVECVGYGDSHIFFDFYLLDSGRWIGATETVTGVLYSLDLTSDHRNENPNLIWAKSKSLDELSSMVNQYDDLKDAMLANMCTLDY